jgi:putative glutamine amidotransferase
MTDAVNESRRVRRPLVGVTADIEWRSDAQPPRAYYELDAQVSRALHDAGAAVVVLAHDDDDAEAWCDRLDGIVVTGGAWMFPNTRVIDEKTTEPWHKVRRAQFEIALVQAAVTKDLPLLGICGGFQILHHVTGGELVVNLAALEPNWAVHAGPDRGREVHTVTPAPGTAFESLVGQGTFAVNSQHRQGVLQIGSAARIAARSADGLIEAIEVASQRFCLGVQWHPEFLLSSQDETLIKTFVLECGRTETD